MSIYKNLRSLLLMTTTISFSSLATIVEINVEYQVDSQLKQESFQVNLYDEATPQTVANFLNYRDSGSYSNSVIHRSVAGFILQGGGFTFDGDFPLQGIATNTAVINEPVYSNLRGTIAMAKLGDNENSATNQWFVNLANNSGNLDLQNGGFTVFGQVISGMDIVDEIAGLPVCSDIPMPEFECVNGNVPGVENFVTILTVDIIDASITTADTLTPTKNTLLNATPTPTPTSSDGGGGGSYSWLSLCLVGILSLSRYLRK